MIEVLKFCVANMITIPSKQTNYQSYEFVTSHHKTYVFCLNVRSNTKYRTYSLQAKTFAMMKMYISNKGYS